MERHGDRLRITSRIGWFVATLLPRPRPSLGPPTATYATTEEDTMSTTTTQPERDERCTCGRSAATDGARRMEAI